MLLLIPWLAGRVLFGISEAFVYVVDTAEWYIELYLDYLEPLSLHYVDPAAHAKPPPRGTKRKPMRCGPHCIATAPRSAYAI